MMEESGNLASMEIRRFPELSSQSAEKASILGTHLNKMGYPNELGSLKSIENTEIPCACVMENPMELIMLKANSTVEECGMSEECKKLEEWKRSLSDIEEENNFLRRKIERLKIKIAEKKPKQMQRFWFRKYMPEKKMVFRRLENVKNENAHTNISYVFHVATKFPFKLSQGEALITFEEEKVAQGLVGKCHTVNLEKEKIVVRAQPVILETGIIFELHANISQRKLNVSNIPHLNIPVEWMKDKLELFFCKTKLGGEVQSVAYDPSSQMALIILSQPMAINNIVKSSGLYHFPTSEGTHSIMVSPVIQNKLERFQMFAGLSRKTILLTGIEIQGEEEECVEDMIAIHFQKPRNGGGEVENIKYVSKGTKVAYFQDDTEDVK
uniref:N-myc and STAT interactor n=1 Tax=Varanus komodoensis TaxID=61221 RepID=A0A8D2LQM3_VARKO